MSKLITRTFPVAYDYTIIDIATNTPLTTFSVDEELKTKKAQKAAIDQYCAESGSEFKDSYRLVLLGVQEKTLGMSVEEFQSIAKPVE